MTDPLPPTSPIQTTASAPGRGLKIALAVSVALNLAIAGMAAGAWLKDGSGGKSSGMSGFGPFGEALNREDRRALRRALLAEAPSFRAAREATEAEFVTLVAALRAEPFDPVAVQTSLAAIAAGYSDRIDLGRSLIEAHLIEMPAADRLAFADRLEARLGRRD